MRRRRGDDTPDGPEMRFLDELDAKSKVSGRLGSPMGKPRSDDLLEFEDAEMTESDSGVVQVFVGRRTETARDGLGSSPIWPDRGSEGETVEESVSGEYAALEAGDSEDDDDDEDDDFDEFADEQAAPTPPPGWPVRLLPSERGGARPSPDAATEEAPASSRGLDALRRPMGQAPRAEAPSEVWAFGDRSNLRGEQRQTSAPLTETEKVWPSLRAIAPEPTVDDDAPDTLRSWVDSLDPTSFDDASMRRRAASRSTDSADDVPWTGPRFDFGPTGGGIADARTDNALADEEAHETADEDAEDSDSEGDTGSWNRLDILFGAQSGASEVKNLARGSSSGESAYEGLPGFDEEAYDDEFDEVSVEGPTRDIPDFVRSRLQKAAPEAWGEPESDTGRIKPPPIQPVSSSLQMELESRAPVEPKAVVLKTLDRVAQAPLVDDAAESRKPAPRLVRDPADPFERKASQPPPPPSTAASGNGRLVLVVMAALFVTVAAVWQWRSAFFSEDTPDVVVGGTPVVADPLPPPITEDVDPDGALGARPVAEKSTEPVEPAVEEEPVDPEASREDRRTALAVGVLYVDSDMPASVFVDGKQVASTPMDLPGLELQPGHHDVRVVPKGKGRPYRTSARIDQGRVRTLKVQFKH